MAVNWPKCVVILLTKGPWLGFGFHRCLHIQGCFAILVRLKDEDLVEAPDDSAFLQSLRFSCESQWSLSTTGPGWGLHYWGGQCPKGAKARPHGCGPAQTQADGWQGSDFFSCIAVLVRDIVGQQLERVKKENKFPRKQKPTRTNTPTKQSNTHKSQTRERSREICKLGETGETSASLSSPSQVLFRQVVLPHVVHV